MINEGASIIKHKKKKARKHKNVNEEKGKSIRRKKRRVAQTNLNVKDEIPKLKSKIKQEDLK